MSREGSQTLSHACHCFLYLNELLAFNIHVVDLYKCTKALLDSVTSSHILITFSKTGKELGGAYKMTPNGRGWGRWVGMVIVKMIVVSIVNLFIIVIFNDSCVFQLSRSTP